MNRRIIRISILVAVLAALFVVVGTALANPPANLCGSSKIIINRDGLTVKKDVFCSFDRLWNWVIDKSADQSALTLSPGQTFPVNYTVTASAELTGNYHVEGNINVNNTSDHSITVDSLTDSLAPVTCTEAFPVVLDPGDFIHCTYGADLGYAPPQNDATAIDVDGVSYSATAPIDWTLASGSETDECAAISDTYAGVLGNACAGQQTSFTFNYARTIGPYDVCGNYTVENTASFLTNDTGATGSDSWTVNVNVPCTGGCTLTPGYWKTHSEFGPAPYDSTWAQLPNGASTPFALSGQTWYRVFWTPPQGNAYYILAHAYMASKLNIINGAATTPTVDGALAWSDSFFNTYTPSSVLSRALRQQAIYNASILDNYNNGLIGPGHCSE